MMKNEPIPANITEPALLLIVNRLYSPGMTSDEIYEITRGNWVVGEDREKARYAFALDHGIILAVYTIETWSENSTRDKHQANDNRWQFTGKVAPHMRHYIGQSAAHYRKKGSANPVQYVNIKTKSGDESP